MILRLATLWLCLMSAAALGADAPDGLNEKEDGGAAAYASGGPVAEGELVPPASADGLPLRQQARIALVGGGIRGVGFLAAYDDAGPRRFAVARRTKPSAREPYVPVAVARLIDPDGNIVRAEDFTDQAADTECRFLEVPQGKPGVWTVSFAGGRAGDLVEVRAAATPSWGIRGELALGVTSATPRPAYLWVPPSSRRLLVGVEQGAPTGLLLQDAAGGKTVAAPSPDPTGRPGRLFADPSPAGTVCRLVLPPAFAGALVVDGAPGLLCPTEEAARRLQGGTRESHDLVVGGPLQARIRDWMVAHAAFGPPPKFAFPAPQPGSDPAIDVLGFGKYGALNSLDSIAAHQDLDPSSPTFGGYRELADDKAAGPTWINFLPAGVFPSIFDAGAIGAAVTFRSPLNPAFQNKELADRAALAAFSTLVTASGDGLIRENSLAAGRYPTTHDFFAYSAIAQGYLELKDLLSPEAAALWREAIVAAGDKLADHQAYESNQWSHMLRGHLDVYLATGEVRFRRYFEREIAAFLDGSFGPGSKFGQHPAGFYLEEFGPDGNYDKLNEYCVVGDYLDYRELPDADPALVEKLRAAIEKNLRFTSLFWLPQPDGQVYAPNAFNCRQVAMLGGLGGYPGDYMARADFPLAARKFALSVPPAKGAGAAATFTFLANTPEWIDATLRETLALGPGAYEKPNGLWVPEIAKAYSLPRKAAPAALPVEEEGVRELPGLLAWKRGLLYGVVFHDVAGAAHPLKGYLGGGPTVLWTRATGSVLSSMLARKPEAAPVSDPKLLTFSCLFGHDGGGRFFTTGRERSTLAALENGSRYQVSSRLAAPAMAVTWTYAPGPDRLDLAVQAKAEAPVKDLFLNLPVVCRLPSARVEVAGHALSFRTDGGAVRIEWPAALAATLVPSALPEIKRLEIPLPSDGSAVSLSVTAEEGGKAGDAGPAAGGGVSPDHS